MPKTTKRDRRDGISVYKGKFRISYVDGQGRRRQETINATTIQMARVVRASKLADAEKQRTLGYAPPTEATFADVTPEFLRYQRARLVPKGYERNRGVVENHLYPALGSNPLAKITRDDVEQYITARLLKVSKATVVKELNTVKHLFNWAVDKRLIPANPAAKVKATDRALPGRLRYLQPTEMGVLLAECPVWLQPIVLLLMATGMRRGELLGLRWLDIYRAKNQILLPETKNGKARIVALNALGCAVVDRLPRPAGALTTDHVFSEQDYSTPENVSVSFKRACRRARIENFRLHDLRHTCASWMVMQGSDIHTVAAQLGHNVTMAARYAHLSPAHLQKAVGGLDIVFPATLALPAPAPTDTDRIPIEA